MASKKKTKSSGWLVPALLGTTAVVGVGLASRRASAKPSSESAPAPTPTPAKLPETLPQPTGEFEVEFPVYRGQEGKFMLEELLTAAQLDEDWRTFFRAIARGESGFDSNVVLGERRLYPKGSEPSKRTDTLGPGEAKGARKAYLRGLEQGRYESCRWKGEHFSWGSGGWLAMLPANAWYAYLHTELRCRHPHYLLHPVDHVVVGIDFARRLTRWKAFIAEPRWLTLRVGWGNPSGMDDPQAHERVASKFANALAADGVSSSWMSRQVTPLPKHDIEQLWEQLMTAFDFEPGRRGA